MNLWIVIWMWWIEGPSSGTLREVQIPVVTKQSCSDAYKKFRTVVVDDSVICAGTKRGGVDACQVLTAQKCRFNAISDKYQFSKWSIDFYAPISGRFRWTFDALRSRTVLFGRRRFVRIQVRWTWLSGCLHADYALLGLDCVQTLKIILAIIAVPIPNFQYR